MTADVDIHGAAAILHRSASWLQKNWRTLTHDATGAPFPRPYIGAARGRQPWWRAAAIEAWKAGAAVEAAQGRAEAHTAAYPAQREPAADPANDAAPRPITDQVAALKAAFGG